MNRLTDPGLFREVEQQTADGQKHSGLHGDRRQLSWARCPTPLECTGQSSSRCGMAAGGAAFLYKRGIWPLAPPRPLQRCDRSRLIGNCVSVGKVTGCGLKGRDSIPDRADRLLGSTFVDRWGQVCFVPTMAALTRTFLFSFIYSSFLPCFTLNSNFKQVTFL